MDRKIFVAIKATEIALLRRVDRKPKAIIRNGRRYVRRDIKAIHYPSLL
jgi:hypothetical protein